MMSRRTDKTRRAASSDIKVIPNRMARCLTTQIRSLVNFFSLKATLIFWTFCSARATHKVRQCLNIWECDNRWPGIDPIEMMDSWLHNTNLFKQVAIRLDFVNFKQITSDFKKSVNFSWKEFHIWFSCVLNAHFNFHIFLCAQCTFPICMIRRTTVRLNRTLKNTMFPVLSTYVSENRNI